VRGFLAVVEDDAVLRRNLVRGLAAEAFEIVWNAADGATALRAADACSTQPDALVLDLGLPDSDGLDVLGALRARGVTAPALVLTARSSLNDRLQSFGTGADDYLTKPFEFAELVARLEVLVRRGRRDSTDANLTLDPVMHQAGSGDRSVSLSPTEYRLLASLLARRGEVVRRATLTSAAWPPGAIVRANTLDAYVTRLRRVLRDIDAGNRLETVRGVGYRLT
jgi:DNA-binding response OmpR family regulator